MARRTNTRTVYLRRKRSGKTNYRTRLRLLSSKRPRLVVRKSLKNLILQVVDYAPVGDRIILCVRSCDLKKLGWKGSGNSLPACYLLGSLLGMRAREKNIRGCILDIGLQSSIKGCGLYAVLKGAVDVGFDIPHSASVFPDEKRIRGEHIAEFAKKLKEDMSKFDRQFSEYAKRSFDPEKLPSHFDEIKKKIRGE